MTINYERIYQYAKDNNLSYNELCAVVVAAQPEVAPAVEPKGWQLVPLEPTQAMFQAGCDALTYEDRYVRIGQSVAVYEDMLAAAPTAPPASAIPRAATESMTDAGAASGVRDPRVLSYCWELMYEAALASITPPKETP
jgi:hypothetical protein